MKIKRAFGFASVVSLAVLLTACGKNQNSIVGKDYFKDVAIEYNDYLKQSATKTEIVEIFKDLVVETSNNYLIVASDSENYYFYNFRLDDKLVLTLAKTDITKIEIKNDSAFLVRYDKDSNDRYAYEVYLADGRKLLEKTTVMDILFSSNGTENIFTKDTMEMNKIYNLSFRITTYLEGVLKTESIYYYLIEKSSLTDPNYVEKYGCLTYEEYYENYGKIKESVIPGEIYGLEGYFVKSVGDRLYIYKGEKLVNVITPIASSIFSDKYYLFQTRKEVSVNDSYDIFYQGKYLQIETYKMNILTSKISKVNNFHYLINEVTNSLYVDGVVSGSLCNVIDFKKDKHANDDDIRLALVKGNGNINVHEQMNPANGLVIVNNNEYTVYTFGSHGSYTEYTTIYDKNGNVKETYNGISFKGILAYYDNGLCFANEKSKEVKFILKEYSRVSLEKYVGYDIFGNYVLVEITDGDVVITNINGYTNADGFLTKKDGTKIEFFALESSLTKFDFSYDSATDEFDIYYDYYVKEDATGKTTIVYFK